MTSTALCSTDWAAAAVQRCYRTAARCALSLCLATRNRKKVSLLSLTIGLPAARWTIPVAEEEGGVCGYLYLCDLSLIVNRIPPPPTPPPPPTRTLSAFLPHPL